MSRKCVLISYVWPEPQSSAAGLRDRNVVEALLQRGFEVVIASAAQNELGRVSCEQWASDSDRLKIQPVLLNDSSFDSWIKDARPDLVIFSRFVVEEQFGWRVRQAVPEATTILDTSDLHFLRVSRETHFKRTLNEGRFSETLAERHVEWESDPVCRELAAIHRVDLAWLVSDFERDLLVQDFGVDPKRLAVSRFAYPDPTWTPSSQTGFDDRSGFCLLGNFRHPPNLDGFRWMRQEIWPKVHALLPNAQLHVFGAYPPREAMEAHSPRTGFLVHGPAKTLEEVFSNRRVSLAPLRFGAGIKGKISDSWWHGVPVVSTSIGREAMVDGEGWGGVVADSAEAFARACVELHEREQLWSTARMEGLRVLRTLFSVDTFDREFSEGLLQAELNRSGRGSDWIRRVMVHATLDSYRYFGKWLELKSSPGLK